MHHGGAGGRFRIGWYASGLGTGSRALLSATQAAIARGDLDAEIAFLFCNREPGEHANSDLLLAMADRYGIPTRTLSDRRYRQRVGGAVARADQPLPSWRNDYDREVLALTEPFGAEVGMLAGYMLIVGAEACARANLLNLHPAAPSGPIGTWQRVIWRLIERRAAESGVLINRVIPAVDEGPVIGYCRYSLRTPALAPLWHDIDGQSLASLQAVGESLPLFQAIRAEGVRREVPLTVQTLAALASRRIRIINGIAHTDDGPQSGGIDLTAAVEAAIGSNEFEG